MTTAISAWTEYGREATLVNVAKVSAREHTYRRRLGKVIVQLRALANDMSQATLAANIHRSAAALSRWETGKATPTAFDLVEIARVFEIPKEDLDLLLTPPKGPVSPVAQRLAATAAAGARRGQADAVLRRADGRDRQ